MSSGPVRRTSRRSAQKADSTAWLAPENPPREENGRFLKPDEKPPVPGYTWNFERGVWIPGRSLFQDTVPETLRKAYSSSRKNTTSSQRKNTTSSQRRKPRKRKSTSSAHPTQDVVESGTVDSSSITTAESSMLSFSSTVHSRRKAKSLPHFSHGLNGSPKAHSGSVANTEKQPAKQSAPNFLEQTPKSKIRRTTKNFKPPESIAITSPARSMQSDGSYEKKEAQLPSGVQGEASLDNDQNDGLKVAHNLSDKKSHFESTQKADNSTRESRMPDMGNDCDNVQMEASANIDATGTENVANLKGARVPSLKHVEQPEAFTEKKAGPKHLKALGTNKLAVSIGQTANDPDSTAPSATNLDTASSVPLEGAVNPDLALIKAADPSLTFLCDGKQNSEKIQSQLAKVPKPQGEASVDDGQKAVNELSTKKPQLVPKTDDSIQENDVSDLVNAPEDVQIMKDGKQKIESQLAKTHEPKGEAPVDDGQKAVIELSNKKARVISTPKISESIRGINVSELENTRKDDEMKDRKDNSNTIESQLAKIPEPQEEASVDDGQKAVNELSKKKPQLNSAPKTDNFIQGDGVLELQNACEDVQMEAKASVDTKTAQEENPGEQDFGSSLERVQKLATIQEREVKPNLLRTTSRTKKRALSIGLARDTGSVLLGATALNRETAPSVPEAAHNPKAALHPMSQYKEPAPSMSDYPVTLYEQFRKPLTPGSGKSSYILSALQQEVRCGICLDLIQNARVVRECLHRFCENCIETSVNQVSAKKECPICRVPIPSRRSLATDDSFNQLLSSITRNIANPSSEVAPSSMLQEAINRKKAAMAKKKLLSDAYKGNAQEEEDGGLFANNREAIVSVRVQLIKEGEGDKLHYPFLKISGDATVGVIRCFLREKHAVQSVDLWSYWNGGEREYLSDQTKLRDLRERMTTSLTVTGNLPIYYN